MSARERILSQRSRWCFHRYDGDPYSVTGGVELADEELWDLIKDDVILQFKIELHNRAYDILCEGTLSDCEDLNDLLSQFGVLEDRWIMKIQPRHPLTTSTGSLADCYLL